MSALLQQAAATDEQKKSTVALKTFFKITEGWNLKAEQQKILLGDPPRSTFYKWKKGEGPAISRDTLERISYILGIYKALRILFPTEEQANAWPGKPNRDFDGESALAVMLKGSMINLADVRRYLDYMRG
ncbi:MbcA/ParS/Xre antitoxin family protein [Marinospirillum sp.]|uniref:MbcA/ParS/Xre antitoxin family protein n=1 Tax=Marinospirillum sp. TaxID=2183934 RepID=UPI00286FD664|nr:MbcA/ParS/Xre antitoxin family protein [Marinospirillum sp.]MDR9469163.1 MbcA/ParS/Xre antitoxin family protein [Marinospirillum sp.]